MTNLLPPGALGQAAPIAPLAERLGASMKSASPPTEENFTQASAGGFVRLARLYLSAGLAEGNERRAIERACVLAGESPAVAEYLDTLGPEACERFTPDHAARAEEIAREERAPGGRARASEFFAHSWPTPRALVGGWLGEGSLGMLYAFRGRGKTWLAYDLALSVALGAEGGDFLGWPVEGEGKGVLYVDGEMRPSEIRERCFSLLEGRGCGLPAGLSFLSRMAQPGEPGALLASLATPEGRAQVERAARGCSLVILDNARTLGLGGAEENESAQWLAAQEWLLSLKRLGCAVLFVHHAGKGGQQRGTSAREDACDYVLGLHPPELSPGEERTQGARAVLRFEKSRGATLAELGARDARLLPGERGGVVWGWEPVEERQATPQPRGERIDRAKLAEYRRLRDQEGLSIRAASEALGVPRSTLLRWDKGTPQGEEHFSSPRSSEGCPTVPLSHPLKGGVGHGTWDKPSHSACPTVPFPQWDSGTALENNSLASVPRTNTRAVGQWDSGTRKTRTEERFSSMPPLPNTTKSASPNPSTEGGARGPGGPSGPVGQWATENTSRKERLNVIAELLGQPAPGDANAPPETPRPTPAQGEERFSPGVPNGAPETPGPSAPTPRAYPRRGGPIPPGMAPIVLFTPKGPGGRS